MGIQKVPIHAEFLERTLNCRGGENVPDPAAGEAKKMIESNYAGRSSQQKGDEQPAFQLPKGRILPFKQAYSDGQDSRGGAEGDCQEPEPTRPNRLRRLAVKVPFN